MENASQIIAKPKVNYYEKIDGLRFVAIAFVLIEHFADRLGHVITAGYYGVDLFFVISGFLITNILLKPDLSFGKAYKNFLGRRTLRIFPIYYLTLGFMLLIGYQPCWDSILYLATYTFNYAWVKYNIPLNALAHFWSLAVEEQFYLIWPLFILSLRRHTKTLYIATLLIIAACFYQLTAQTFESINPYNFVGLFPRAGSLCLGAFGAMLFRNKHLGDEFFGKNILVEWMVMAALLASLVTTYDLKYVVLALCSLYLVLKSAHSEFHIGFLNRFLSHAKVRYIGSISYGIYIYHVPIGIYLTTQVVMPWLQSTNFQPWGRFSFLCNYLWIGLFPIYTALSIGLAALSSRFVEKPILTLKDRFFG